MYLVAKPTNIRLRRTLVFAFFLTGFLVPSISMAQELPTLKLKPYKRIDEPARNEVSGIVKSAQFEGVFWVHGDSGTPDRIYAIDADGNIISEDNKYKGAKVKGAKNEDWEDIALGQDGTLILADIGNNCECRDDLKIYILEEPKTDDEEAKVLFEYQVKYPERNDLIGQFLNSNYNAEAVFQKDGIIYILTKQLRRTRLFKLENPKEEEVNELVEVESILTKNLVTAADISPDGSLLAVLLYDQVIIFEISEDSFLKGRKAGAYLEGTEQVESIVFDEETLIIAEENGDLYQIEIADLVEYED